jgi:hypothetical protein
MGSAGTVADQLADLDRWTERTTREMRARGHSLREVRIVTDAYATGERPGVTWARLGYSRYRHTSPTEFRQAVIGLDLVNVSPARGPPTAAEARAICAGLTPTIEKVAGAAPALSREQAQLIAAISAGGGR